MKSITFFKFERHPPDCLTLKVEVPWVPTGRDFVGVQQNVRGFLPDTILRKKMLEIGLKLKYVGGCMISGLRSLPHIIIILLEFLLEFPHFTGQWIQVRDSHS